jgi:hypothetical protein
MVVLCTVELLTWRRRSHGGAVYMEEKLRKLGRMRACMRGADGGEALTSERSDGLTELGGKPGPGAKP